MRAISVTDLCEDEELRERIVEIQREIEHSRLAQSRELSRRRSTNIRRWIIISCALRGPSMHMFEFNNLSTYNIMNVSVVIQTQEDQRKWKLNSVV